MHFDAILQVVRYSTKPFLKAYQDRTAMVLRTLHSPHKGKAVAIYQLDVLVLFGGLANLFELHIRQHHFVSEFDASMQGKDYFILEEFCTKRLGVTHSMLIVSNSMSVK